MHQQDFEARVREVKSRAHGQWTSILKTLGVDEKILNRKNQPCPMCGGTDRFQYTDRFGEGNYHCRGCGAGGGLKLARATLQCSFAELLRQIEAIVGTVRPTVRLKPTSRDQGPSPERMKKLCKRIWDEAQPIVTGDEVDLYLRNRGLRLETYPRTLRRHAALGYYEKVEGQGRSKKLAEYPAMLACIQGRDGHGVSLHRTYLKDGCKALGSESKKVLSSGINGAAIRLSEPAEELAITEGIETGLAVHIRTGKPVWSAISAGNMEKLWVPSLVTRIWIYADNDADANFDGQAAAYALARRLKREPGSPREVEVHVPKRPGFDWADVLLSCLAKGRRAA